MLDRQIRGSIVVSISACHAEDPGSISGRGVFLVALRFGVFLRVGVSVFLFLSSCCVLYRKW